MNRPPRTIRRDTRVFISAVSRELGTVRKLVKKALEDNDYHAVEQDNFPPDYRDLQDKLHKLIESCDAVVHIAGHCYGAEPTGRPADAPRRSYTQLEYDTAVALNKPVYVFLTGDLFPADQHDPEPAELEALQAAHRQRLASTRREYTGVPSREELDQKVRSLQLKLEKLGEELRQTDVQVKDTGRRLGRWLVAVAVLVIAALGAVGYFGWRQGVEHFEAKRERAEAEAARQEARKIEQIEKEFAERFLQQLLASKDLAPDDARQRALKELPALVKLPLAEIQSLIDRKIAPNANLSPLERARSALTKGEYASVLQAADEQNQQGRELAMLEGTAALAQFRKEPKPQWNERALAAFRRAMALADPNSESEWQAWTDAAVSAASVFHDLARHAEAEPLLRESLRLHESHGGQDSPGVATVINNLAYLLKSTNRLAEAEPLYRRALAIAERSYGPDHPEVAIRLNNLAALLYDTNRRAEAEPLHRRALAIVERSYGPDHPEVAIRLNNLALLLTTTNRLAEAEPLYRHALAIDERSYGPDHPTVATNLNNLALLLKTTNRLTEAEPLYRRALAIAERSYGPNHPTVAIRLNNLAALLRATNRPAEAEPLHRRALAIDERSYGTDHPDVARDLNNLAALLHQTNRLAKAEPLYRRALAIAERSYGPNHPTVAIRLNNLGELLRATNRRAEAEPLLARAVRINARFQRATGHVHPDRRPVSNNDRGLLSASKRTEPEIAANIQAASEATEPLAPIVPDVERLLGPAQPVAEVLADLDRQYREQGRPAVYFLKGNEPIAPHLDELLRPRGDALIALGTAASRRGAHADAVVLDEAATGLMADDPGQAATKLIVRMNRAAALRELGLIKEACDDLSGLLPELDRLPAAEAQAKGRARYHRALCQWRLGDPTAARRSVEESLATYDGAPKEKPVPPAVRQQSEQLLTALKAGEAPPPPLAKAAGEVDAKAAIEAARARYRATEALMKLPLDQPSAPLLEQALGPAQTVSHVLEALDRQYREQKKPAVWLLPLNEPIAPHLDEILGKPSR